MLNKTKFCCIFEKITVGAAPQPHLGIAALLPLSCPIDFAGVVPLS